MLANICAVCGNEIEDFSATKCPECKYWVCESCVIQCEGCSELICEQCIEKCSKCNFLGDSRCVILHETEKHGITKKRMKKSTKKRTVKGRNGSRPHKK